MRVIHDRYGIAVRLHSNGKNFFFIGDNPFVLIDFPRFLCKIEYNKVSVWDLAPHITERILGPGMPGPYSDI